MGRSKGTGSLACKGGKWYLVIKDSSKRSWHSLDTSEKAKAEIKAEMLLEDLKKGMALLPAKAHAVGLPLNEVWHAFEPKAADCSASTMAGYKNAWTQFKDFLKSAGIDNTASITPALATAWMESLKSRKVRECLLGLETIIRLCKGVSRVMKLSGCVDPFHGVSKPKCMIRARK